MDKFFIQNAFKTLDEIEAELNQKDQKETLQESLKEDLNTDFDMDELQDKYIGLGCSVNDPKSEYVDEHGSIQELVDFEGDFKNSIWKITLDIGISLNIPGESLTVDLEEKLPKDLAQAYLNARNNLRATKQKDDQGNVTGLKHQPSDFFPKDMDRRKVTIDFENSNYTEISKEEALKKYKAPGERCKLRVLFNPGTSYAKVMMWDEDNMPITQPQSIESYVDGNAWSFKNVIAAADKIYVTDENEHKIDRTPEPKEPEDPDGIKATAREVSKIAPGYWTSNRRDDLARRAAATILYPPEEIDSGSHSKSARKNYEYRQLRQRQYTYKKLLFLYNQDPSNDVTKDRLERALKYLRETEKNYLKLKSAIKSGTSENSHTNPMSESLAELIVVKYLLKKEKEKFQATSSGTGRSDLQYHQYKLLEDKLQRLNKSLQEVTQQINQVKSQMTPELKADYDEKMEEELLNIGDKYVKLLNDLKKLRTGRGLATEDETNESLEEDLIQNNQEENPAHLRIYTVNVTGYEDFIDNDWASEEEALNQAKELSKDQGYERVCLVKIKYLPDLADDDVELVFDSDANPLTVEKPEEGTNEIIDEEITDKRSIGEIVDDIIRKKDPNYLKNESLKESKAFNLKDDNQVVDAVAYKGVGEETDEKLVVVDPTLESKDDKYEPHEGDAIIQCEDCKKILFLDPDKLEKDGNSDIYNKDMPCPHCGAKHGFKYLYQAAAIESDEPEGAVEEQEKKDDVEVKDEVKVDEDNNANLEPVEDDFIELDEIDDIKEESFEKLVNPYLTKLYENIQSFKTTNIYQINRNTLKLEGKLTGTNGKEKLVEFLFKIKENNANSIVFEGYNNLLTEDVKAYNLKGKLEGKSLVFESFEYKYTKKVDGQDILIEGIEK